MYDMILLRQSTVWQLFTVEEGLLGEDDSPSNEGWREMRKTIQRLLSDMRLISAYNPESFGRKVAIFYKLRKRHQLFGQIVRFGIPALWFTINSSDLKNPVVLRVAGTDIHPHLDRHEELNRLRRLHAIGNPTIVA
jgi:hypothetical protein